MARSAPLNRVKVRTALMKAPSLQFSGIVARCAFEKYRATATSPAGAARRGGRYTPIGTNALYTSIKRTTAFSEFTQYYTDDDPLPVTCVFTLMVFVRRMVDLTDPSTVAALGTTPEELGGVRIPGRPFFAQAIGEVANGLGIHALLVWSAQEPAEKNLVVLPDNAPPMTATCLVVTALKS